MTPYIRFTVQLPGETVELFCPELEGTKRPYVYDIKSHPTNMVYSPEPIALFKLEEGDQKKH